MNVLVVDDDVDLCTILSRFFEKHGMRVYSVSDALQAMDVVQREPVQMVIADFRMPHLDGIGLTEQIKSDPKLKHIPVILMSNHITEEMQDEGMRKGAAMILSKPVRFDGLLNLVRFAE